MHISHVKTCGNFFLLCFYVFYGHRYLHDERGVKMCDILVHGHSMGGAVAICLAVRYADDQLKCVADRTFSQLPLVVGEMLSGA